MFVRDSGTGEVISEIKSGHKETQPFEAFRMYSPLPFMRVNFSIQTPLDDNLEIVIALLPAKDIEWA